MSRRGRPKTLTAKEQKQRHRDAKRQWKKNNPEKVKKQKHRWYLRYRKRILDQRHRFYLRNRKRILAKLSRVDMPIELLNNVRERDKLAKRRYKVIHPERFHARELAKYNIHLKDSCQICGSTKNLQRHHDDYSKPLDVRTVCNRCDGELRRENRLSLG